MTAAAAAFAGWAGTPPGRRRELLNAASALLRERAAEIAGTMTEETGATFGWGMFNCDLAARMLGEAAAQTYAVTGEVIPSDVPGALSMGVRQPAGVVVGMAPWNAPVILSTRSVATPLAYGNTVVLKGSEKCPRTHAAVARAIADAGLPAGAINFVAHSAEDAAGGRRRADRPSRGAAGELHGLHARGPDRRRQVRRAAQAMPARARRQGAPGRAGRRRPRRGRRRGELRRVHELRPDLHVDGADRRRPVRRRRPRGASSPSGRRSSCAAIRATRAR